jgi:flagellar biosynthetic protein FlhB
MSASETSKEDRQLPASERRLQQAREDGQLARSRDLVHLAVIGALLSLLMGLGPWVATRAMALLTAGLRFDHASALDPARMLPRLSMLGLHGVETLVPLATALAALMAGSTLVVGGWNFTLKALEPRLDRIDPMAALGRLFAWRQVLSQLRLAGLAGALLGCAGYYVIDHAAGLDALSRLPLADALPAGFAWIAAGLGLLAGVCVASAAADVPLQIFRHRSELKMTLEEAKQENKESEGDPHVKGIRRQRQREMARGRMLSAVPKASVVVTNPTHYAVALQYDETRMGAPRIVALGKDLLAFKIRELAVASRVPVLEAPPLARALYRHGEVDRDIPVALYAAVAQVLAWVYRLRTAVQTPPEPQIEVPPGLDPLEEAPAGDSRGAGVAA